MPAQYTVGTEFIVEGFSDGEWYKCWTGTIFPFNTFDVAKEHLPKNAAKSRIIRRTILDKEETVFETEKK